MVRQERPDLARRYWQGVQRQLRQRPGNILKNYIEQQKKPS
jgi:hypothetical protein